MSIVNFVVYGSNRAYLGRKAKKEKDLALGKQSLAEERRRLAEVRGAFGAVCESRQRGDGGLRRI
jgi:hypothetical protein